VPKQLNGYVAVIVNNLNNSHNYSSKLEEKSNHLATLGGANALTLSGTLLKVEISFITVM